MAPENNTMLMREQAQVLGFGCWERSRNRR